MELADIFGSIRRHWKLSIAVFGTALLLLAIFLVTRDQVQPQTRYGATVQVRIPAISDKGALPENVPSVLLQGQTGLANRASTLEAAYQGAGILPEDQSDFSLAAGISEDRTIIYLNAEGTEEELVVKVANSYGTAFVQARAKVISDSAEARLITLQSAIGTYSTAQLEVERQLTDQGVELPNLDDNGQTSRVASNDTATNTLSDVPGSAQAQGGPSVPPGATLEVRTQLVVRNRLFNAIRGAQESFAEARIASLTPNGFASTVERTGPDQITPPVPSPLIPIGVALGAGLLLAVAVPVLRDRLDHTIKDARTASAVLGAPVLTTIPPTSRTGFRSIAKIGSPHDSAFRALAATSIATDRLPRAIVVTSPTGRVQDMVAANFAAALAGLGLKVALVGTDADQAWFLDNTSGSAEAITFPELLKQAHSGNLNGEVKHRLATSELANLVVVPPGVSDRELALDGLPPLLDSFEDANIDVVVIAGPSLLEDPNTTIFAWSTRSVLWALEIGEVTRQDAQESADRLALAGVDVFGVAMVGREI